MRRAKVGKTKVAFMFLELFPRIEKLARQPAPGLAASTNSQHHRPTATARGSTALKHQCARRACVCGTTADADRTAVSDAVSRSNLHLAAAGSGRIRAYTCTARHAHAAARAGTASTAAHAHVAAACATSTTAHAHATAASTAA